MGYGITSPSQIIDLATIKQGCSKLRTAVGDFEECGNAVIQAGETLTEKALSVDESTLEYSISSLGEEIVSLKATYEGYADQVEAEAVRVFHEQKQEYENYLKQLKENKESV